MATPSFGWSTSSNSCFRKGMWEMNVWNGYFAYTWLMQTWFWNLSGKWFSLRTLEVLLYFFFSCFQCCWWKSSAIPSSMFHMYLTFLFLEAFRISFLSLMVGKFMGFPTHIPAIPRPPPLFCILTRFSIRKLMPFSFGKLFYLYVISSLPFFLFLELLLVIY